MKSMARKKSFLERHVKNHQCITPCRKRKEANSSQTPVRSSIPTTASKLPAIPIPPPDPARLSGKPRRKTVLPLPSLRHHPLHLRSAMPKHNRLPTPPARIVISREIRR